LKLGLELFFVIIYNRFVDSSKCGPRGFDPQSKNSSRAPECSDTKTTTGLIHYINSRLQLLDPQTE